jgi:hypothetical protein
MSDKDNQPPEKPTAVVVKPSAPEVILLPAPTTPVYRTVAKAIDFSETLSKSFPKEPAPKEKP